MKNFRYILLFVLVSSPEIAFGETAYESPALNEIQVIGSHNSYKKALDPSLMLMLSVVNEEIALSLDYHHQPLSEQLALGLRSLEIDVFFDPKGGRYQKPFWHKYNPFSSAYDESGLLAKPGFKVMHVQDLDFRSHCLLLKTCLKQVRTWSNHNPKHLPLIITINPKDDIIPQKGFTQPLPFTTAAWAALDKEFRLILGDKLIVPDDIRGEYASLREAVLSGWPSLNKMRGKILFVLDTPEDKTQSYIEGHKMLSGRVMFVDVPEDSGLASFRVVNDPIKNIDYIKSLVEQGFIVRTRADADTMEARNGDFRRLRKAIESGAQIISSDYYYPDPRFSDYSASINEDVFVQCNPVLVKNECAISSE